MEHGANRFQRGQPLRQLRRELTRIIHRPMQILGDLVQLPRCGLHVSEMGDVDTALPR